MDDPMMATNLVQPPHWILNPPPVPQLLTYRRMFYPGLHQFDLTCFHMCSCKQQLMLMMNVLSFQNPDYQNAHISLSKYLSHLALWLPSTAASWFLINHALLKQIDQPLDQTYPICTPLTLHPQQNENGPSTDPPSKTQFLDWQHSALSLPKWTTTIFSNQNTPWPYSDHAPHAPQSVRATFPPLLAITVNIT